MAKVSGIIGQVNQSAPGMREIITLSAWLLGALLLAAVIIALVRYFLKRSQESATEAFTLEDLRQLHRQGDLSDEEFERAKAAIIESTLARDRKNLNQPGKQA